MSKNKKIFVAGGTGFVGKRIVERLARDGYNFVSASLSTGVDFRDKSQTENYFKKEKPEAVINCAAYVGGIRFNAEHEGEIYYNNTLINLNLQECVRKFGVKKYIDPIANCSYPDVVGKDFKESEWWDGPLHPSVMVYGFTKKATWVNAYAYKRQYGMDSVVFLVPNIYGPGDHFDEVRSHAMGALIMKMVQAKENKIPQVTVWGTGRPVREWLYVDDCVEAFIRALDVDTGIEPVNIGQGVGLSIKELAEKIKAAVGYDGQLFFDISKPDGAPYKIMNVERMKSIFHWAPSTSLDEGIKKTVDWYYENILHKNR
jgi:GDP-L-fucose synthase